MTEDEIMDKGHYIGFKYNNRDSENQRVENSSEVKPIMHKQFETRGIFNFGELELGAYGWVRTYPLNVEENIITMSVKDEKNITREKRKSQEEDYLKTYIFDSKNATAVLSLDFKEHYHQMDLFLKTQSGGNQAIIKEIKIMFERGLKCELTELKKKGILEEIVN
jgi:hypothetical protein